MRYAEIAVDAPVGIDRTFTYSVPPSLKVNPGHSVVVPFGKRRIQGLVFSLVSSPPVPEIRDIIRVQGTPPPFTNIHLQLARWISRYYMCNLFEAAALMLPPGGRVRPRSYISATADRTGSESSTCTPSQRRVLTYIRAQKRVEENHLINTLGEPARQALRKLLEEGLAARHTMLSGKRVQPKRLESAVLSTRARNLSQGELAEISRRAPRQGTILHRLLSDPKPVLLSALRKDTAPSAVRALITKGLIEKKQELIDRDPLAGKIHADIHPVALTYAQRRASSQIRAALDGVTEAPLKFLLQGVTGSGKTEVYLDAVAHCRKLGKRAIVLAPEIALTQQTIERFVARFPGDVAVLHSRLSLGERFDQWWKIRRGERSVIIGARSAIFAPVPDLGLIIIDEEHEWTYKQLDSIPRYHDKFVALQLGDLTRSVVVLGSATPDVESYSKALSGSLRLLRLPERVLPSKGVTHPKPRRSSMASVDVVDMRNELRDGNQLIFSRKLMEALRECLVGGEQAMLFLNRRGSSSFLQCRGCGLAIRCRRCDTSMAYHNDTRSMQCHYCGERRTVSKECPRCHSRRMVFRGVGTQSVAREAQRLYPEVKVVRWDRDSTRSRTANQELLAISQSGEARIIVGTQMIAKGLHFPSVTLVGVISADVGLNMPHFQASERVFQLLCQVAGRAGRGPSGGRVIIQTYDPENYAIKAAAAQDYQRFYHQEISYRAQQGNPPYNRLIRLLHSGTNQTLSQREALRLSEKLAARRDAGGHTDNEVLGPTPAYPARVRGQYRWQIVLRGPRPRVLLEEVSGIPQRWVVDVDPVGLA